MDNCPDVVKKKLSHADVARDHASCCHGGENDPAFLSPSNVTSIDAGSCDIESCDPGPAILSPGSIKREQPLILSQFPGKDTSSLCDPVLFSTPCFNGLPSIGIHASCCAGTCTCQHLFSDMLSQLIPCRATQYLFGESALPTINTKGTRFVMVRFC